MENIKDFDWEVKTEIDKEELLKNEEKAFEKFEEDYKKLNELIKNINQEEEKIVLYMNYFSNIEDIVWNKLLKKFFSTNLEKNLINNYDRNEELLNFKIVQDLNCALYDEKYKTSTLEKYNAWKISEDIDFSSGKPEVMNFFGANFYQVRGQISRDVVKIPFVDIFNKLKLMDNKYPGILLFIFNSVIYSKYNKLITLKDIKLNGVEYLQNYKEILLMILRYRNDYIFNFSFAWNINISKKIETKDIGYFSIDSISKIIGNIWVSEKFRNIGIGTEIFNYIKTKILPKEKFLFIQTKNEIIENHLRKLESEKINLIEIGMALSYGNEIDPIYKKEILKNEKTYVLTFDNNQEYIERLNIGNLFNNISYSFETYPLLENKFKNELFSSEKLYEKLTWKRIDTIEDKLKVLNITNDINILPEQLNTFTNKKIQVSGRVIEMENEYYLLPMYDNKYYIPFSTDLRLNLVKLEKPFITILETSNEWIILLKFEFESKHYIYSKERKFRREDLEKLFNRYHIGVENIFKNDGDFKPIEIDYNILEIKFKIENITTNKKFEEILDFLI